MAGFVASFLLRAQGGPEVKKTLESLGAETDRLRQKTDAASTATKNMGNAVPQLDRNSKQAAASISNLTANLNDIGVMMAAGQNPFQLAIQQGTQITQVLGPMGVGGAVRALGSAFMAMISPINLVTIATIAGGVALTQWMTGAAEKVKTFDDLIAELSDHTKAYQGYAKQASSSVVELAKDFGSQSAAVRQLIADLADLELRQAERAAGDASRAMTSEMGLFQSSESNLGDIGTLSNLFDFSMWNAEARYAITDILAGFDRLDRAPTLTKQISAAETLRQQFLSAAIAAGGITSQEDEVLKRLSDQILKMRELQGAREAAFKEKVSRDYVEPAVSAASDWAAELAARSEMLAVAKDQEAINALIVEHGQASLEVATARVQAARDELQRGQDFVTATDASRVAMLAVFDAKNQVASVDIAGNVTLAANEAARLANNMAWALAQVPGANLRAGDDERGSQRAGYQDAARVRTAETLKAMGINADGSWAPKHTGGGGASRGAQSEASAVERLIERKEAELAVMRAANPVAAESARNREVLTAATDAQRQKIEELTAAIEKEKTVQEAADLFSTSASDFLSDIVTGSASAGDALDQLINKLIDAGIQALLLGSGPLAGLFGTAGTSIGDLVFGSLGVGRADGGMIYGAGGPREDKVPVWMSAGEMAINARATARNRAVLEYINAGGVIQGFADGGVIGRDRAGAVAIGGAGLAINVDARGAQRGVAEEIVTQLTKLMPVIEKRALGAMHRAQRQGRA